MAGSDGAVVGGGAGMEGLGEVIVGVGIVGIMVPDGRDSDVKPGVGGCGVEVGRGWMDGSGGGKIVDRGGTIGSVSGGGCTTDDIVVGVNTDSGSTGDGGDGGGGAGGGGAGGGGAGGGGAGGGGAGGGGAGGDGVGGGAGGGGAGDGGGGGGVGVAGGRVPVPCRRTIVTSASLNVGIVSSREQLCPKVTNKMGQPHDEIITKD